MSFLSRRYRFLPERLKQWAARRIWVPVYRSLGSSASVRRVLRETGAPKVGSAPGLMMLSLDASRALFRAFRRDPRAELDALDAAARYVDELSAADAAKLRERLSATPLWGNVVKQQLRVLGAWLGPAQPGQWLKLCAELRTEQDERESGIAIRPIYFDLRGYPIPSTPLKGCATMARVGPCRRPVLVERSALLHAFHEAFLTPEDAGFGMFLVLQEAEPAGARISAIHCTPIKPDAVCEDFEVARMNPAQLRSAQELADEVMDLPARRAVYAALSLVEPNDRKITARSLALTEKLLELDTKWTPTLGRRRPYGLDPTSILHLLKVICPDESSGGAVRSTSILEAQVEHGLSPVACMPIGRPYGDTPEAPAPEGIVEMSRNGVLINYLNFPTLDLHQVAPTDVMTFEATLYDRIARRHRCSLVHAASGFRGFETALKGLAVARANNLPLVYEVRSFHEHTWRPIDASGLSESVTRLRMAQEDRCMAAADAVVTISRAMMENLAERGVPTAKLFLVPNAIADGFRTLYDPSAIAALRSRLGFATDVPTIGYISNFSAREGHSVLLDAFTLLMGRGLKLNLLLVGDGPERMRLSETARARGLAAMTAFPGNIDHGEIKAWYGILDLFVVPRVADRASDQVTPLKPFEAMSQGVPLLMSDRPVSIEIVGEDERRGALFPTGDAQALAARIEAMLQQPEAMRTRAGMARDWVLSERTWNSVVKRYDAVYAAAHEAHDGMLGRRRSA